MTAIVSVQAKSMWTSKTFWINLIVALLAFVSEVQAILPAFADIIVVPQGVARWALFVTAIANILLRRISDAPARFSPENEPVPLEKFDGSRVTP
jgi:hypothetical protein